MLRPSAVAEERLEHRVGTGRWQRIKAQLRVVRLAAPAVLVLRPVVHQQYESSRGQAVDETVEQGLRLGVNPVQVFADEEQRLHLAFAQQHPLERLQGALAPLGWIEPQEGAVLWQSLQQRQQGRNRVLERLVQRQHLPGDFGADDARLVVLLHVAIVPQEFEYREVGRGFTVGHRGTL